MRDPKDVIKLILLKVSLVINLILIIIILLSLFSSPAESQAEPVYVEHTVQAGESLWGIARRYRPDSDPREAVWEIREENGVDPLLFPGQVLRVRVKVE